MMCFLWTGVSPLIITRFDLYKILWLVRHSSPTKCHNSPVSVFCSQGSQILWMGNFRSKKTLPKNYWLKWQIFYWLKTSFGVSLLLEKTEGTFWTTWGLFLVLFALLVWEFGHTTNRFLSPKANEAEIYFPSKKKLPSATKLKGQVRLNLTISAQIIPCGPRGTRCAARVFALCGVRPRAPFRSEASQPCGTEPKW